MFNVRFVRFIHPELCMYGQRFFIFIFSAVEIGNRRIQNTEAHSAADVHADSIRNHSIFYGKNSTDWKSITTVCIRH